MIVVDTSAFVAILFGEADGDRYLSAIAGADQVIVGAPTALELQTVLYRKSGPDRHGDAAYLLAAPTVQIIPWTADHVTIATGALHRFGGRPARLNFGDCMVYAVAKALNAPLLYKGGDFAQTDIRPAL